MRIRRKVGIERRRKTNPDGICARRHLCQRRPVLRAQDTVGTRHKDSVETRSYRVCNRLIRVEQRGYRDNFDLTETNPSQARGARRDNQYFIETVAHSGVSRIRLGRANEVGKLL